MKPYYKILGVDESATIAKVKKAYRDLSKKYHPDKHQDLIKKAEASTKQAAISEAYSIIGDKAKRLLYDELGINCSIDAVKMQANQTILQLFKQVIRTCFDKDTLFVNIQTMIDRAIGESQQVKDKTEERIEFLNSVIDEKVNGSREHLKQAINEEIQNLSNEIIKVDTSIAVHKKAKDILDNDYSKEVPT